jgi:hypothetical protein
MRATADDDQRFRLIATSHIIPIDDDQAFRRIATTGSARSHYLWSGMTGAVG